MAAALLVTSFQKASATANETFSSGSFIINMGVTPQTYANGLKPYGMLYDLIMNYNIEVKWVINTTKAKDGADFTYSAVDYKGGPFIIRAEDISSTITTRITYWQGQGVQGVYTTSSITVPVYATLSYFPKAMIDDLSNNDNIIAGYYTNAALPSTSYVVGDPSGLTSCQDIWVNPHGDPTWTTHSYLYNYVTVQKSFIWMQCHSVSVMEGTSNPSSPYQQLNYLTTSGLKCYSSNKCGLSTETHVSAPTSPFTHNYPSDPVMQFMGTMDGATTSGSERWYIPQSTSAWRSSTLRLVTTSDGTSPNEGVKLVYGPAYGDSGNGYVMYEGGHDLDGSGTTAEKVAAQRAFFNFLLLSGLAKQMLLVSSQIPTSLTCGQTSSVYVTASGGTAPYTYAWSNTVGGSFANSTTASTTFTAPGNGSASGVIKCIITDACGRQKIVSTAISNPCALPVGLLDFSAKQVNNSVELEWRTATEDNNDYFTLSKGRSPDAVTEIANIKGAGTASTEHYYSFTDGHPFDGDNYYSLSQTDYDGHSKTYPIIHIKFTNRKKISAFPIPFDNELQVDYLVKDTCTIRLTIFNSQGEILSTEQAASGKGENSYVFRDVASLGKGIYFIAIKNEKEGTTQMLRVMKQ